MDKLTPLEVQLKKLLLDQLREGKLFFKAKFISEDYKIASPKQIGTSFCNMSQKNIGKIRIIPYSRSRGTTTWKVERC